jgi:hypothetical protein
MARDAAPYPVPSRAWMSPIGAIAHLSGAFGCLVKPKTMHACLGRRQSADAALLSIHLSCTALCHKRGQSGHNGAMRAQGAMA